MWALPFLQFDHVMGTYYGEKISHKMEALQVRSLLQMVLFISLLQETRRRLLLFQLHSCRLILKMARLL